MLTCVRQEATGATLKNNKICYKIADTYDQQWA